MSQVIPEVFLFNRVGYLRCLAEEVKVLAHIALMYTASFYSPSKSIIVEIIVGFFQLVAQPIVGVFEVDAARGTVSACLPGRRACQHTYLVPSLGELEAF